MARWNHCSIVVEAIPNWKYFVFGGSCATFVEGEKRSIGRFSSQVMVFDSSAKAWDTPLLEDENGLPCNYSPLRRELSSIV